MYLPIKDNQVFFPAQGCGWVGQDTGGIFLFEFKFVMVFENRGFN